jgi:prepilin-type N-terminal cleavage/methylation domain-containing protein
MAEVHRAVRTERALHNEQAGRSSPPPPTASRRTNTIALALAAHPNAQTPTQHSRDELRTKQTGGIHVLRRIRALRGNQKGFSLIEVSIVSVTLSGLAAIAIFSVNNSAPRAEGTACTADVRNVRLAEEAYFVQTNDYAETIAALIDAGTLKTAPPAGEVTITLLDGPPSGVTVGGSATSECSDFSA